MDLLINIVPSHNPQIFSIVDLSYYGNSYINNPSLEITTPAGNKVNVPFTPKEVNSYTTVDLGISPKVENIPDGIYTIKYSVYPNLENFIVRTFMIIDNLLCEYRKKLLNHLNPCDCKILEKFPYQVPVLLQGAVSAANECNTRLSLQFYEKAKSLLSLDKCNNC